MKTNLLLLFLLGVTTSQAQMTYSIDWEMGISAAEADLTITAGDTVEWLWADTLPHTVTSLPGAAESFASAQLSGEGESFEHTFTTVGSSDYQCNVHPMMQGTITVEEALGLPSNQATKLSYYPNPVNDVLTISAAAVISQVSMYDANGRKVLNGKSNTPEAKIYMSNYPVGTYFVKIESAEKTETFSVIRN